MKSTAQKLCELVDKKYIVFTPRGNTAIKLALQILRMKGKDKLLVQDQGGWLTYPEIAKKLEFKTTLLKTDYGIVSAEDLSQHKDSILLINSMPGYHALQDMEEIEEHTKNNNIFLINDVSGSIGTIEAKHGDIIIGSFGNAKPIDMGQGGFIAANNEEIYKELCELNIYKPDEEFLNLLNEKLDNLDSRLAFFEIKKQDAFHDLNTYDAIHPELKGINLIVKFNNDKEKEQITEYCKSKGFEFTECPRYIRVNTAAISIEIKRLNEVHKEDYNEDKYEDE